MRYFHHGVSVLACILLLTACGRPADRVEITDTVERSEHQPVPRISATSEERFARALPRTAPGIQAAAAGPSLFEFHTPDGWTQVASTQFRNPNFLVGPAGEAECYVSVAGGGLFMNANRWRGQMGQKDFTEEEFAEQTRVVILGSEGIVVDFEGAFSGMVQGAPKEGYRLIGALVETPDRSVFIKMIGPKDVVGAQKDKFTHFAESLRVTDAAQASAAEDTAVSEEPGLPPDHPTVSDVAAAVSEASAPSASEGGFSWELPDGWEEVGASPMRVVTLSFGEDKAGECYVVVLTGTAGGPLGNMNRWLTQMGDQPTGEGGLDLLPRIEPMGGQGPLVTAKGTYTGMGGQPLTGHVLLGASAELDGQSIFIRLIAPEQLANANRDNFIAFCASIEAK